MYLAATALMAAHASMSSFDIVASVDGLRWLRVHLITLGAVTRALFGVLPSVERSFILAGGTLVFAAAALLTGQLVTLRGEPLSRPTGSGLRFDVVGVSFLLLGIVIGIGLWARVEQERVVGRRRNGRWLDGSPASTSAPPPFAADPDGRVTPLDTLVSARRRWPSST
jgi:hypothetical protein